MAEADLSFRKGCLADFASGWRGLRLFYTPRGRSSRTELVLLAIVPQLLLSLLAALLVLVISDARGSAAAIRFAAIMIALIPLPMAMARRLHDMGKTGWLVLPGMALIGIGVWDAWLDVVTSGYPANDLWHNRPSEELLYGFVSLAYAAFLMLPAQNAGNRHGPDPRPAPRTI